MTVAYHTAKTLWTSGCLFTENISKS